MLSVLHVTSTLAPEAGGFSKAVIDLACAQAGQGQMRVVVFSTFAAGHRLDAVRQRFEAAGVELHLAGPTRTRLHLHPQTRRLLRRLAQASDVVHVHGMWEDSQHRAAVESRRAGRPYVWTPHGMLDPWSLRQSRWKKRLMLALRCRRDLNHAAALHFTTDVERDLVAALQLRPTPIVESLGLDFSEFDSLPAPGEFRAQFPQIGNRRIVLFMSRVHYKKGLNLLIPAFAKAAAPDDVLVIAGPIAEGYLPELQRLIEAADAELARAGDEGSGAGPAPARGRAGLPLRDRVIFTGMLHGRQRLAPLVDATVFVLPSYQENFGLAVAEAVAAGCPTIISDQVNIWKELSAAGAAGVVPTDESRLTEMLRLWLNDESIRSAHSAAGKAFARRRYDWQEIARRWLGHYQALVGRGG
ncbi:MAG: glycosyltransferase [Phycisphaerales bacterium]|nr:glycosyltransferase [Phycisphaerales bacterium]